MNSITDNHSTITDAVKKILLAIGEDVTRPGLRSTPERVAKSIKDLTKGQGVTPGDVLGDAIFPCTSEGMIVQKNVEFYSLCEHHLLPFYGNVHLAYLPAGKIIGLSKIGRLIDVFSQRLQVQENLTSDIANALQNLLQPKGVAIMIEADHFCMKMRGVKKQGGTTATYEFLGAFKSDQTLRGSFLQAINLR